MLLKWLKRGKESELESALGYRFKDVANLEHALTHRSFRFEHRATVSCDNQRLEFLGDAILGFLSAEYVYSNLAEEDEGALTSFRSQVTSGKALAEIGQKLGIGDVLLIGQGEARSGGSTRASNLADAVEALLAAAYIDGGIDAARAVFNKVIVPEIEALSGDVWAGNPKGELQNLAQKRFRTTPVYELIDESGPSHRRTFRVKVMINEQFTAEAEGGSKRAAQAEAANILLKRLLSLCDT